MFSGSEVIAITINSEDMTAKETASRIMLYKYKYNLPATNVLKFGCDNLINKLFDVFPELNKKPILVD